MSRHFRFYCESFGMALVPLLTVLLIFSGCAPIAPSVSKDRFRPDAQEDEGSGGPISLDSGVGTSVEDANRHDDTSAPNVIRFSETQVERFRSERGLEIDLGQVAPSRLVFVVSLSAEQIETRGLGEFRTHLTQTGRDSERWLLRIDSDVPSPVSQEVLSHLVQILADFNRAEPGSESGSVSSEVEEEEKEDIEDDSGDGSGDSETDGGSSEN